MSACRTPARSSQISRRFTFLIIGRCGGNYTEGELMVALFELGARRAADAVRNGEQTAEALAEALLARCAAASPLNAFISLEADRLRAAARAADQRRQREIGRASCRERG